MEPLFDEYTEGRSDEGDYEAEEPKNVDKNRVTRFLERWGGEVWRGRIDEVPVDSQTCNLV